jgi:hypothetical protein
MAELPVPTFRSGLFMIHRDVRCVSADASEIGYRDCGPLYSDAADVGIAIERERHRRCRVARFYLQKTCVRNGEILWWHFLPCTETVRACPDLSGWGVRIFND